MTEPTPPIDTAPAIRLSQEAAISAKHKANAMSVIALVRTQGLSLKAACETLSVSPALVTEAIADDSEVTEMYDRARMARAHVRSEAIHERLEALQSQADGNPEDIRLLDVRIRLADVRARHTEWSITRDNPEAYGDKLGVSVKSDNASAIMDAWQQRQTRDTSAEVVTPAIGTVDDSANTSK